MPFFGLFSSKDILAHSNLFFFSLVPVLDGCTLPVFEALLGGLLFQYKKNWKMIIVFKNTPKIYYSLKAKSSDSIRTVAHLAIEPAKFKKKLKKARAPVDLLQKIL